MSVAASKQAITQAALAFAWGQWTQMGVSGFPPDHAESRAADPEALILFTLEVARHDPRLFDEALDWLVLNESLVSVQRLRNLCLDERDRTLVDASLGAVSRWRPRTRLSGKAGSPGEGGSPAPLFIDLAVPTTSRDAAFERHGLLRRQFEPSQKSQRPDFFAPINFAFRLRRLLGVGARAEVVRVLLTTDAHRVSLGVIIGSAAFARPNVRESLSQLRDAGTVALVEAGGEQSFTTSQTAWTSFLDIPDGLLPRHGDWIQTLGPLRLIIRWLHDPSFDSLSDYMRSSEARSLMDRIAPDLQFAGIRTADRSRLPSDFWDSFVETTDGLLDSLHGV